MIFMSESTRDRFSDNPRFEERFPKFQKLMPPFHPLILLLLKKKPSYGYELVENFSLLGVPFPPDMSLLYKTLRGMEKDGLVQSEWDTEGSGPAKRIYHLTPDGEDVLRGSNIMMKKIRDTIDNFLKLYEELTEEEKKE